MCRAEAQDKSRGKAKILIIEDELITARILTNVLREENYTVTSVVSSGEAALDNLLHDRPDLVIIDIKLEDQLDGMGTAEAIRMKHNLPTVYLTDYIDNDILERAKITEPFHYISKPINPRELDLVIEMSLCKHSTEKTLREESQKYKTILEDAFFDLVRTICRALEYRDPYTSGHQKRVAELSVLVGQRMELDENKINELYIGGMLHDIGKIGVPIDILTKASPLSVTELLLVKDHAKIGYEILKEARLPWDIMGIIRNHHEKLDGSGYPNGIFGDKISTNVRIITVCDIVEAMSTIRPYRAPRTRTEVVSTLMAGRRTKYDAQVVDIMVDLIDSELFNPWKNYDSESKYAAYSDFPEILIK